MPVNRRLSKCSGESNFTRAQIPPRGTIFLFFANAGTIFRGLIRKLQWLVLGVSFESSRSTGNLKHGFGTHKKFLHYRPY
jgi:hypothetical protein